MSTDDAPQENTNIRQHLMSIASNNVRTQKRKSHDRFMLTPQLAFVCSEVMKADVKKNMPYNHARNALAELISDHVSNDPAICTTYVEPLHDEPPANKKSKISRVSSMPSLVELAFQGSDKADNMLTTSIQSSPRDGKKRGISMSQSAPSLGELSKEVEAAPTSRFDSTNPETHLRTILAELGVSPVKTHSALELEDFFLEMTDANIDSYGTDIITAVRQCDIAALRQMHREGRMLQCCNRFGESIVHMACRRGSTDVVRFLMEEAGVSIRVRDDYGRTPLHDACWTREPEIELVKMLITNCPDLLLVTDKRGFAPLAYVRTGHWGQWCEFLEGNRQLLFPSEL